MPRSEIIDSYSLSPMQKAMFFQSQYSPDAGVYLLQLEGEFLEDLDTPRFWDAWRLVIGRHSILRTSFHVNQDGEPYQVVHSHVEIPLIERDLRSLSERDQEAELQLHLQSDWEAGFDLASPPLLRLALFRLADERFFFVRTIHHLLSDSRSSFMQYLEVFSIYQSLCKGIKPALEPARNYREYVDWLSAQDMSAAQPYWRDLLAGFTLPTPLYPRKISLRGEPEKRGKSAAIFGSKSLRIPADISQHFRSFVNLQGITLNTLLQGAWAILLSRYSGEAEVVFGGTRNCRKSSFKGAQELVGPMVNTLPVRARLDAGRTTNSLLKELRDQWISMRPFEHTPLTIIAGWSAIPAGERLFESVVNYDHLSFNEGLRSQSESWKRRTFRYRQNPGYPLALNGFGEKDFILQFYYDRSLFDDQAIERMLSHVETILRGMVSDPDRPVCNLPILAHDEQEELLRTWHGSRIDFPQKKLVHQQFEESVGKFPEAAAVIHKGEQLTYRQLDQRANQLSAFLVANGVTRNRLVAVYMQRSLDVIVALLGILKAGGAYLPLDPELPPARIEFMLADARPAMVLSQQSLQDRLAGTGYRVICLDRDWADIEKHPVTSAEVNLAEDDLAYVIYTSGSTGSPKGVEITHRGLRNLVNWHNQEFSVTQTDRATQVANLSFDASVWEIWPYLAKGAQIHLLPDEVDLAPDRLVQWIGRAGITISFLPTPICETILDMDWPPETNLRILLTGGDRLQRRPSTRLPFHLINNYGPTECTVVTTSGEVLPEDEIDSEQEPALPDIGRPIMNVCVYVLDRHLNLVPVGIPGELFIGGAGVGRGYLNQPGLTGEKFIENPFDNGWSPRLYRSGDRVRYLGDGRLEYLGRFDTQVKVRGIRLELGEIESLLLAHPGVARAAVLQHENAHSQSNLVAYIESKGSLSIQPADLAAYLRARLPAQVLPGRFVFLEAFPLTTNQKIDRKALASLPLPEDQTAPVDSGWRSARTALESAMAGLWAEVLGITEIGIRDSFFELGGNSLSAIRLVSQIIDFFDIDLPLKALFTYPTIEELNSYLETAYTANMDLESAAEVYLQVVRLTEPEAARMLEEKFIEHQMWGKESRLDG